MERCKEKQRKIINTHATKTTTKSEKKHKSYFNDIKCPLLFVYIVNSQSSWAHLNKIKKVNDAKEIKDCLIHTAPVL